MVSAGGVGWQAHRSVSSRNMTVIFIAIGYVQSAQTDAEALIPRSLGVEKFTVLGNECGGFARLIHVLQRLGQRLSHITVLEI